MNIVFRLACVVTLVLTCFVLGRFVGAACTQDCDNIEAYVTSNTSHCFVVGTEFFGLEVQCSKRL